MKLAPIVVFVHRRPKHTFKVLRALADNPEAKNSEVFVFQDPTNNSETDTIVALTVDQFKREFKNLEHRVWAKHYGLKKSTMIGMAEVFLHYPKVIVLEDDVVVANDFLRYMNEGLVYHRNNKSVFSLTGNCPPIDTSSALPYDTFLYGRFYTLGWATWLDRWASVDWNIQNPERFVRGGKDQDAMLQRAIRGKVDAFAIKVCYAARNRFTVFPRVSKTRCIGFDGSGTNCRVEDNVLNSRMSEERLTHSDTHEFPEISKQIDKFYNPSLQRKIINRIRYGV